MENGYKFNILLNSTKKVYLSYSCIFGLSKKLLSKIKIVNKTIILFLCFCPISFHHINHYEESQIVTLKGRHDFVGYSLKQKDTLFDN